MLSTAAAGTAWIMSGPFSGSAVAPGRRAPHPLSILILGATGFIGPHFVEAAVKAGHRVSVFLNSKSAAPADVPLHLHFNCVGVRLSGRQ